MFCNKCGAQLEETTAFCTKCGNPVQAGGQTAYGANTGRQNIGGTPGNAIAQLKEQPRRVQILIAAALVVIAALFIMLVRKPDSRKEPEKKPFGIKESTADNETSDIEQALDETMENVAENVENALDTFQIYALYGTWEDANGAVSFTFKDDGTIRIGGLDDTLGADLFTYTEVDNNTLELKAASDSKLLNMFSVDMDYKISGDTMTVELLGQTYQLTKQ